MKKTLLATVATVLFCTLPAAQAQWTVIDPTNLVQNTLTAIRTLQQIDNQVRQLQNEAQMLINQARNLDRLDYNTVNRLRSTLATIERLMAEAQGLAYRVENLDQEFARLYPHEYAATVSGGVPWPLLIAMVGCGVAESMGALISSVNIKKDWVPTLFAGMESSRAQ